MSQDRLVYSSDKSVAKKDKPKDSSPSLPAPGPTKIRLETKGRGGRAVTVLWNFPFAEAQVRQIMKVIQERQACGATFKAARIEFQGDVRAQVQEYFKEQAWKLVAAGG